jgi:hypothetical protein
MHLTLLRECSAMIAFALSKGLTPPESTVRLVEGGAARLRESPYPDDDFRAVEMLTRAHRDLSRLVAPALPGTIARLDDERRVRPRRLPRSLYHALGPLPIVRRLVLITLAFLLAFVLFAASPAVRNVTATSTNDTTTTTTSAAGP